MACNVYLTFFRQYNADQLRQLEWKYVIGCYGLPFIPAFVYFFIHTPSRGPVYGSAIVRILYWYHNTWFLANFPFLAAVVLGHCSMGLSPNRSRLRPRLVHHLPHLRHLSSRRLGYLSKTTRTTITG